MRLRATLPILGTAAALAVFGTTPASAYPPLALGAGSGCAPIGGSTVSCQVYPTGGYGNYSACWNGTCGPYEHLYFSELCVPNSTVSVQVTVHDATGSVSATYSSKCLGGPFLP